MRKRAKLYEAMIDTQERVYPLYVAADSLDHALRIIKEENPQWILIEGIRYIRSVIIDQEVDIP